MIEAIYGIVVILIVILIVVPAALVMGTIAVIGVLTGIAMRALDRKKH